MTSKLRLFFLAIVTCALASMIAPRVHAQATAGDKAAAEALFDLGLSLMRDGKYAEACAKLEQSQAVEPGIGTMLYLAECYERAGRSASAWALFRQAASEAQASGQTTRAQQGRERAAALEPKLSKLTIRTLQPVAAGMQVLRDGEAVSAAILGVPVPVDPGEHVVAAHASGYASFSQTVKVEDRGNAVLEIPALVLDPSAAAQAPSAAPAEAQSPATPSTPAPAAATSPSDPKRGNGQRLAGLVVGSVGVVALGLGTYFGLHAISKNSDAEKACPHGMCSSPSGQKLSEDANDSAVLSNVFVFGGAAVAVTGILLYVLAPKADDRPDVAFVSDGHGFAVSLGGRL